MRPKTITDDALLAIARECFLSQGPSVSTAVIAARAGVSQATLFKRFGTKGDLLLRALGIEDVRPWLPRLEAGPDERPIRVQLHELAVVLVRFFDRALPSMMAFHAAGPRRHPHPLTEPGAVSPPIRARRALTQWFEAGQASGRMGAFDADTMAVAFIGAVQAPALRRHLVEDDVDLDRYTDHLIEGFWRGVAP